MTTTTLVVDDTFTVGADTLDGDDGNDVLIGDDSVLVETTVHVQVGTAANFERFVEGVADAGDELAHAVLDLKHLEHHLRDEVVLGQARQATGTTTSSTTSTWCRWATTRCSAATATT